MPLNKETKPNQTWNNLPVCKQIINIKMNYWYFIAMLEPI